MSKQIPQAVQFALRPFWRLWRRVSQVPLEYLPNSPDLFQSYRRYLRSPGLERKPGGWQYRGRFWPDYLTVGGAGYAIHREALRYCQGRGIDVGAGLWPLPGAQAVDVWRGPGAGRDINEVPDNSLQFVFSSHCLEHIVDWKAALGQWVGKLVPGGFLFLYLPHPDCSIWERGSPFVDTGHEWSPSPPVMKDALKELGCEIVAADDGPDAMWSFFLCGRRGQGTADISSASK